MTQEQLSKRTKDISGNRYGRLVVLSFAGYKQFKRQRLSMWNCLCDCGNHAIVRNDSLVSGLTKSCGCLHSEVARITGTKNATTHGLSGTKEYITWTGIKQRCFDKNSASYKRYGALGIGMEEDFIDNFEAFLEYVGKAPSESHSIDRIDNNKGYVRGNMRWVTDTMQARNKLKAKNNSSGVTGVSLRTYKDGSEYWVAMWNEENEFGKTQRHLKTFSVKKFGYDLAFELACDFREYQLDRLRSEGYGYSDNHGQNRELSDN